MRNTLSPPFCCGLLRVLRNPFGIPFTYFFLSSLYYFEHLAEIYYTLDINFTLQIKNKLQCGWGVSKEEFCLCF